jgi:nitrate reductase gamma subunit
VTLHHIVANATVGVSIGVALIGLGYRRRLEGPMRWLLVWATVDAVASFLEVYTRIVLQNSQYVAQVWYPISAAMALAVAASSFGDSRGRRLVFAAAVAVAALIVSLTVLVEQYGYFSRYTGAIHGLSLAVAGALLVIRRALTSRGAMMADPAFLVGAAFLIIGAPSAFLALSKWHFPISDRATRALAYTLKNMINFGASALVVASFYVTQRRTALRERGALP